MNNIKDLKYFYIYYKNILLRKLLKLASILFSRLILSCHLVLKKEDNDIAITISFPNSISKQSFDGRLLLIFADNDKMEPRFQVSERLNAQPFFGINFENFKPNISVTFTNNVFGFPYENLSKLKPDVYYA